MAALPPTHLAEGRHARLRLLLAPARRRLIYVATRGHRDTAAYLAEVLAERGIAMERAPYDWLLTQVHLPRATYILTDLDRLDIRTRELAGRIRDRIAAEGLTVLNDPRRFVPRAALLRRLHAAGINGFTCWLPRLAERPDRFPVFLRTEAGHRGPFSGLLHSPEEAGAALNRALDVGHVLSDLVFVEYCPQDTAAEGWVPRHTYWRMGGAVFRGMSLAEERWPARSTKTQRPPDSHYAAELADIRASAHDETMHRAFEIGGLDFGRLDFCYRDGRPQVFEINSNPFFRNFDRPDSADKRESIRLVTARWVEALDALAPAEATRWRQDMVDLSPVRDRPDPQRVLAAGAIPTQYRRDTDAQV